MNFKTAASALVDVGADDAEPAEVDCPVPGDDILEPINALIALAKDAGAKLLFDAAKLTKYEHVKLLAQASSKLLVCLEPAKQLKVVSGSGSSSSSDIDELTVDASAAVKMTHAARAVRMAQTDVAQRIQSGEASEEDAADFVRELTQQAPKKATKGAAAAATTANKAAAAAVLGEAAMFAPGAFFSHQKETGQPVCSVEQQWRSVIFVRYPGLKIWYRHEEQEATEI